VLTKPTNNKTPRIYLFIINPKTKTH